LRLARTDFGKRGGDDAAALPQFHNNVGGIGMTAAGFGHPASPSPSWSNAALESAQLERPMAA
jgi:hypothetical protein